MVVGFAARGRSGIDSLGVVVLEDSLLYVSAVVFLISATPVLEIWVAIPVGVALGLDPISSAIVALVGNALPVVLIIIFYDRINCWLRSRSSKEVKPPGRARRRFDALWAKYGLPAAALTAPVTIGTHMVALMVMAAGTKASDAIAWMVFGLMVWAVVFTVTLIFGISFFFD